MKSFLRLLEFAIVWGGFSMLVRYAILTLREPAVRRGYAIRYANGAGPAAVEEATEGWRRRLGRSLWINLVAIPLCLILILVAAGEFSSGISLH